MENNLLRIGVLLLIGVILYNVVGKGKLASMKNGTDASEVHYQESAEHANGMAYAQNSEATPEQQEAGMAEVMAKANTSNGPQYDPSSEVGPSEDTKNQLYDFNYNVLPYPQISKSPQDSYLQSGGVCQPSDPGCYSGSTLQAPDLLPTEGDNAWLETSPKAQGHITDQNWLESGHHNGINTVGQSLKNANKQLRSDPRIPKINVGPWLQSTYDPDTNRKPFEIGTS